MSRNKIITILKTHKFKLLIAVLLLLAGLVLWPSADTDETSDEPVLPVVTVSSPAQLNNQQAVSIVGTVRAFSEAALTAETAGRVTSVNASLAQTVPAGFIIATLENASEQAAVLQAEGAYEAALASAEQSEVGLSEANTNLTRAQNTAISTYQSAYNTVNSTVLNNIDEFFANPDSAVPGLRINGRGQTNFLNQERIAFQTILRDWQAQTSALTPESDLPAALSTALIQVNRAIVLVDTFVDIFNDDNADRSYSDAELNSFSSRFSTLRTNLQAARANLNNDLAALENAADVVRRAEIAASGSQSSASDAQVKQALGSLRAAQANLAKTIIRTPISGTVNSLNVRVGDFVSNQDIVARVANNNALEIVTFVGDNEVAAFTVGSTVLIEDTCSRSCDP
jgi:multidrug resistance efflux pump